MRPGNTSVPETNSTVQAKSDSHLLRGDTMVYLTITLLVGGVWQLSQLGLFKAGDDLGYWLGVAGGVMMLLLFSYPLRKHFRFAHGWGRVKWWFVVHMLLGIGGPLLILLHSTFKIGSLNAGVALYSMLIVAGSGVVGRFLYSRVNRGLRGETTDFKALQARAGLDQQDARSRLSFAPAVEQRLKAFEQRELSAASDWGTHVRRVFWLPVHQWLTYRACTQALRDPLQRLANHSKWTDADYTRREAQARKLVRRYLTAVTRVAQYSAYERLFSLWHIAHIPFVYLLVISAIVHVVAVHAY